MPVTFASYQNPDILARSLAAIVAGELLQSLRVLGRATLAVPGGTTPRKFLAELSGAKIDWANTRVMLTDERFVPESSDRSNTRLLCETLLKDAASAAQLVPLYQPADQPEDVLVALSENIRTTLPLTVAVLGMGTDMHTASLFPGADRLDQALDPEGEDVLLPMRAPGAPEPRLTLTAPVLRAAKHLHLLIIGRDKLAALKQAEAAGPVANAPVRAILSAPGPVTIHYTDEVET